MVGQGAWPFKDHFNFREQETMKIKFEFHFKIQEIDYSYDFLEIQKFSKTKPS